MKNQDLTDSILPPDTEAFSWNDQQETDPIRGLLNRSCEIRTKNDFRTFGFIVGGGEQVGGLTVDAKGLPGPVAYKTRGRVIVSLVSDGFGLLRPDGWVSGAQVAVDWADVRVLTDEERAMAVHRTIVGGLSAAEMNEALGITTAVETEGVDFEVYPVEILDRDKPQTLEETFHGKLEQSAKTANADTPKDEGRDQTPAAQDDRG